MKISNKLRYFSSIALLLLCFLSITVSVSADESDEYVAADEYSEIPGMEYETEAPQDEKTYVDGRLTQSDVNQQVQSYAQMIGSLFEFSEEEVALVKEQYSEQVGYNGLFETFDELKSMELGKYKNFDSETTEVVETDENIADVLFDLVFEKGKVTIDLKLGCYEKLGTVYKGISIVERVNVKKMENSGKEPSFGEKMSEAGVNTLMGMGTVFVVLIFMSLIISCFRFIPMIMDKFTDKENKKEPQIEESKANSTQALIEENGMNQSELIAVITAAIVASEQKSTDSFVVRSIKRR